MRAQRGFSLGSLLMWSVILVLLAIGGMKIVPSVIEYGTILKDAKKVAVAASPQDTVAEIRKAFQRFIDVDNITSITPAELDISKQGNEIVIEFFYAHKIPLGGPVSLLIEYQGSTRTASQGAD